MLPAVIVNVLREILQKQLKDNQKTLLDFISCISLLFVYANSSANAILFLMTNVKVKKACAMTKLIIANGVIQFALAHFLSSKSSFHPL